MKKFLSILSIALLGVSLFIASATAKVNKGLAWPLEPAPQASPLSFHLIVINEVYTNADGSLQFVELLAISSFQTNLGPTRVTAFNANGAGEAVVFDFTASFPALENNETILLATRAYESVTGTAPDFVIPDRSIPLDSGRVVFKQDSGPIVDAVAYGMFTGNNSGFGSPAPALPRNTANSLTRVSRTRNNATDFAVRSNSPLRNDGRSATIRGGFILGLLSDTDEIIRIELATGNIVQRVPAGFDLNNDSGIDVGTAPGVNNGNPFVVVTQVNQVSVRLYDAATLMEIGRFDKLDVASDGVGFDGTNWFFSLPAGVMGNPSFQGAALIDLPMSVATGRIVVRDSINLNSPDGTFDVFGGVGIAGPGVAVVTGRTGTLMGGGNRALVRVLADNNRLTRDQTLTTEAGNDGAQPGVSGPLVSLSPGNILVSVPESADLRIVDPRTGMRVGTLRINGVDFTNDVDPNNAISGLSSETGISPPR
jgi:hypothetical protein